MEGFKNGRKFPEAGFDPDKNVYAEIHGELKDIMRGMTSIDRLQKKHVFDRMLQGPDMALPHPELAEIFEQIADVEEKYGKERVAELAAFYVTPATE